MRVRLVVAALGLAMVATPLPGRADAPTPAPAPAAALEEFDASSSAALRSDLERLVESQQRGSWQIDKYEFESMMPSALMSVCQVNVHVRTELLARLDAEIVALGGPFEVAWARTPELEGLGDLLFVTRVRTLLALAVARAPAECPLILVPKLAFTGLQSDRDKWSLNVETGGVLQLRRMAGHVTYGFGGGGRLLVSRGFGETSFLFGPELSGGAMLQPGGTEFVINYFGAFPMVLRLHHRTWHYDFEVAPVALFQASDTHFSFGGRLGFALGVQARRSSGVIPWAGLQIASEYYFAGARDAAVFLRGGLRIGIIWN